jgi:hypothetical protein
MRGELPEGGGGRALIFDEYRVVDRKRGTDRGLHPLARLIKFHINITSHHIVSDPPNTHLWTPPAMSALVQEHLESYTDYPIDQVKPVSLRPFITSPGLPNT